MWRTQTKEPQCAYPRLHELRVGAGPRRERGQEYSMGWAGPSGSPYVGGGNEPRSPFPLALGMGSMSPVGHFLPSASKPHAAEDASPATRPPPKGGAFSPH